MQKKYLDNFVSSIKSKTSNKDDQVRIAISLVQKIPYDYSRLNSVNFKLRSPYELLYESKGVCSEKSLLLAHLLREFGYGIVLFDFSSENHMAVGIKSPNQYSYKNTGYAFIEATAPSIPTDSQGNYVGAGRLISTPQIFQVSDGISFSSISEEYQDAQTLNRLTNMGPILAENDYLTWRALANKYGIIADSSSAKPQFTLQPFSPPPSTQSPYTPSATGCPYGGHYCFRDYSCYLPCSKGEWDDRTCMCITWVNSCPSGYYCNDKGCFCN
jgi:hypothetical protein